MADSNARAQAALAYFRSRGYSDVGAAAIVGNLVQESGLDPTKVHDNGTGLGMAGWRDPPGTSGGRRSQLRAFAAAQGKPDDDFMTQLAFLDHELNTSEKGVGDALRSASDVTAANAAMISFERPQGWTKDNPQAGHGWANRLANAQRLLGGGASVSIPTGVDFGGAVDAAPVSRLEAWQHEQEAKAEGPGLWGTLSAAIDENSITKDLLTAKPEFTPDLNYRLDDKEVKNLQETYGIRDDNLSDLEDAVSPGHAEWLSKQIQAKQQRPGGCRGHRRVSGRGHARSGQSRRLGRLRRPRLHGSYRGAGRPAGARCNHRSHRGGNQRRPRGRPGRPHGRGAVGRGHGGSAGRGLRLPVPCRS
jgi:hypothetical protein